MTLLELYNGCEKRLKVGRTIVDGFGNRQQTEKILTVTIKPGYKAGTKIKFPGEGILLLNMAIKLKPNPVI